MSLLTLLSNQGGTPGIVAALAATEAQDTAAFAATVSAAPITAALAATEAKDIASFSATFTVSGTVTAALATTEAKDIASMSMVVQQLVVDDTHDGDYLPKKFKREQDERNKRKRDILNAYEILVEGKSPVVEELIAQYAQPAKSTKSPTPRLDIDRLIQNAEAVNRLWNAYIDMDDEEILLLL